jgi:hypothetical protein
VSGTYSVYGSHSYVLNGTAGGGLIVNSSPLSVTSTFSYFNSGDSFNSGGDFTQWFIMDTTAQKSWLVRCIIGGSYINNMITIEEMK